MTVLPILTGKDNPQLRIKTAKVAKVTKGILKLLSDMEKTRVHAKGAGLAAPQVGRSERVCIAIINRKSTALINPRITWHSKETETAEEGCLSLPEIWVQVPRAREIHLTFTDAKGHKQELALADWDARVVQHEVDHLDGVLIVDYIKKSEALNSKH